VAIEYAMSEPPQTLVEKVVNCVPMPGCHLFALVGYTA
jgi:hypothetical protein